MQVSKIFLLASRNASRLYALRAPLMSSLPAPRSDVMTRALCVARPVPKTTVPQPGESKPSSVKDDPAPSSSETVQNASEANIESATQVKPETKAEEQSGKIPDVPSTSWSSFGFEEEDQKDPNKWKKFAWKYAGAVLLFMISYKTLHWYVDRMEADGKRRRQEMEENKQIAKEIRASERPGFGQSLPATAAPATASVGVLSGSAPATGASVASVVGKSSSANIQEPAQPSSMFDQVNDEGPKSSSELDELYVYRVELEAKLRDLSTETRTKKVDAAKEEVELELKELEKEIEILEKKKGV